MSEILTDAERSQLDGDRAERTFEIYRGWADAYTLRGIEKGLRGEAVRTEEEWSSDGGHSRLPFVLRFGWAWFVGAFAFGALIGLAGVR